MQSPPSNWTVVPSISFKNVRKLSVKDEVSSPLFTSSSTVWNSLNLWESINSSFHRNLLCSVFPLAVTFLHNWKTIISLTIICHSISVFLAKKDRTSKCRWKLEEIDSQSKPVWPDFIYDQSAHENWTHVSLSCVLIRQAYFYTSRVE